MKNKSFAVCIVLYSILSSGVAFASGEGFFMKEIQLTQGFVALVDDANFDLLNQFKWQAKVHKRIVYAARTIRISKNKRKEIKMHRVVMGVTDGNIHIDHINHNGLDNREENLRTCTHKQNHGNRRKPIGCTSAYKGVSWHNGHKKWVVQIIDSGQRIFISGFDKEIDAAKKYNELAVLHFGEFANLNIV